MVGSVVRLAVATAFCGLLAGCASPSNESFDGGSVETSGTPLQCVPYARAEAHIPIYGDAYTWWDQAAGRYARSAAPSEGAVMVLHDYAGPNRAHLAVVRDVIDSRDIRVDHANWLDDGAIYVNDPVRDVSADNDWSAVRVYNLKAGSWGAHVYPVQGFIGPGAPVPSQTQVAQNPAPAGTDPDETDDTDGLAADPTDLK
ncbi:MAG: CHAP domain-containing protein [Alphaproteobacteria bacterium]|nr:CHAP domain-containing protein [Alphaproteobacteria bacterium]MDE2109734.1 CHAP domain-containing protein [Alphaproteobacteria bacterium]MDE2494358.1 CHAP domain-containing protein [Alphaproteobacteria bacterium]